MTMTSTRIMDGLKSCIRDRFMEKQTLCRVALTAGLIVTSSMCMPRYSTAAETRAANPYQEGMDLMRAGNYDMAAELLEQARKLTPDNAGVLYQLGLAYYNMENFDEAVNLWKRAAKKLPEGDMMKATLLDIVKRGVERKAQTQKRKSLENMLEKKPALLEEGLELASIYEKEGLRGKAGELYGILIKSHPRDARAYAGFGSMAYRDGRILQAELYYGLALGISPGDEAVKSMVQQIKEELDGLRDVGYEGLVKGSH